ncbi:hypothetical protein [Acinetobacter sp.]|uniref:hypothetical protein n=1 Tax=Acinetobacter sp. TaxID=472 RepID=UPI00388F0988
MSEEKNSVLRRKSRYVSGGITEVSTGRLEWWERSVFQSGPGDLLYTVEKRFEGRLDLVAAMFLGEPRLWWVIAQYNSILDPYSEIVEGATITIPTVEKVNALLDGRTGGIPSAREVPISILPIV